MTVLSGQTIRRLGLVEPCLDRHVWHGMSAGLGPAGYDLTVDLGPEWSAGHRQVWPDQFLLAATLEHFNMPPHILGVVHDKSSWARRGLTVQNTIVEPGWNGYLTLELKNHSGESLILKRGMAIAQVVFHRLDEAAERPYAGKYQGQGPGPQEAR